MLNKTIRSVLSLALVFCLLLSMSGNAIALAVDSSEEKAVEQIKHNINLVLDDLSRLVSELEDEAKDHIEILTKVRDALKEVYTAATELEIDYRALLKAAYEAPITDENVQAAAEKVKVAAQKLKEVAKTAQEQLGQYESIKQLGDKVDELIPSVLNAVEIVLSNPEGEELKKVNAGIDAMFDGMRVLVDRLVEEVAQRKDSFAKFHEVIKNIVLAVGDLDINYRELVEKAADMTISKENLQAAIDKVQANEEKLLELIKEAQREVAEREPLKELGEKIDRLFPSMVTINKLMHFFVEGTAAVIAKARGLTREELGVIYKYSVKLGKPVAEKIYNWLYENPEIVCHFVKELGLFGLDMVTEYGPYALELLNIHFDVVVMGMKLTNGGAYVAACWGAQVLGYKGDMKEFLKDYEDEVKFVTTKLYGKFGDEAKALVKVYVDYLNLEERYYNATHADYTIYNDSKYIAFGDRTALNYAELFADKLYTTEEYNWEDYLDNRAEGMLGEASIENLIEELDHLNGLVKQADLVTLGFGNMKAIIAMIDGVLADGYDADWDTIGNDTLDELVGKIMAELEHDLSHYYSEETVAEVVDGVEAFAYAFVKQQLDYVRLINKIQAINPNALIVISGSHNEMANTTVVMHGHEIAIGKYLQPLVDTMNLQSLAEGFLNENVIYVHASKVELNTAELVIDLDNNREAILFELDELLASEAGLEYIAQQMRDALNVTDMRDTEEEEEPSTPPTGGDETTGPSSGDDETTAPSEPTEPGTEPTEPGTEPTEPGTEPTEPGTEPTEPGTEPTEPGTEPTEPGTEPTEPGTEPTEPGTEPTDPSTEPTDPSDPSDPSGSEDTDPTDPTQPGGGEDDCKHENVEDNIIELIEADCVNGGLLKVEIICADCGYLVHTTFVETDPLGHDAGEPVFENIVDAGCVNVGSFDIVVYCERCGEELSRQQVKDQALGHDWGCWELHKLPTCTEDGELRRFCKRCGCMDTFRLPALGSIDCDFQYRDELLDMLRKLYDMLGDKIFELVEDATHADYTIFHDSLYLAIGDSTVAVEDSYFDKLGQLLEIPHMSENLGQMDMTIADAIELVGQKSELISQADLITLGFSNIPASRDMLNAMLGEEGADWSAAIGETASKAMNKALEELKTQLVQEGLDEKSVEMILDAANAYAYAYAARAMLYPSLVESIRDVNKDALIVIVGTYNDLEGVVVDVEGRKINVGKYAKYLICAANLENLLQAIVCEDVIYVHAPEVETVYEEMGYGEMTNLGYLMSILNDEMLPTEAGQAYIAQKIYEALNVKYAIWGDVNGDRKVNCRDARLILRYVVGQIEADDLALEWGDVNGDGKVNTRDARLILRLIVGQIDHFPVCRFSEQ